MDVSFTAWSPSTATNNWMANAGSAVSGQKTFICPSTLPAKDGNSGIPTGWTRANK